MKELKSSDKIVQQLSKNGAVEVNKATGGEKRISARDAPDASPAAVKIGSVTERVQAERAAAKKRAIRKANRKIYENVQSKPETKSRLEFRERDKPPNGKLTHALERPGREAALAVHSQIRKSEGDNSGVQAAHFTERTAEGAARTARNVHSRLKHEPQRKLLKAEQKAVKTNANAMYKRDLQTKPGLDKAGAARKAAYKRKIKKDYARAFRQGNLGNTVKKAKRAKKNTERTAKSIAFAVRQTVKFIVANWKWLAIVGCVLGLIILLVTIFSSILTMFGGGFNAVIGTSYTAEDADILGADADYAALESNLAARIARVESDYPGYDEYRYDLDQIGHDPFTLASYLTAKFNMYTREQVQAELAALFAQQYTLTLTPETEVRYRTETRIGTATGTYTDEDGEVVEYKYEYEYEVQVAYNYYILNVSLTNRSLGNVAFSNLTPEQYESYLTYMETSGNKPELFEGNPYAGGRPPTIYDIPPEALNDARFAAMLAEAEKYLGYPYVWGGSSPSTSFDCSGYVSWVINNSGIGYNVGRMGAKALSNWTVPVSPADAKPGDLIFFWKTYNAPDPNAATHVGIYVGGGYMIHCGNPISYASITTTYWVNHFYGFGRLP